MVIVLTLISIGLLVPLAMLLWAVGEAAVARTAWAPFLRRTDGTYPLLVRGRRSRALAVLVPGSNGALGARWSWLVLQAAVGVALAAWLWLGPARSLGVVS